MYTVLMKPYNSPIDALVVNEVEWKSYSELQSLWNYKKDKISDFIFWRINYSPEFLHFSVRSYEVQW